MDIGIVGKNAIICGASRGIGYACAKALIKEGVNITIVARDKKNLLSAAQRLKKINENVHIKSVAADLATEEGAKLVLNACSYPDILITNTGRLTHGHAMSFTNEEWKEALDIGLHGPWHLIQMVIQGMCNRRYGRIINILGSSVKAPLPHLVLTNTARAGLLAAVVSLGRDVAKYNVTINNLLPGPMSTKGLTQNWSQMAKQKGQSYTNYKASAIRRIPANRLGKPSELAELCAFLCNEKLGYLTCQSIVIDGGAFLGLF